MLLYTCCLIRPANKSFECCLLAEVIFLCVSISFSITNRRWKEKIHWFFVDNLSFSIWNDNIAGVWQLGANQHLGVTRIFLYFHSFLSICTNIFLYCERKRFWNAEKDDWVQQTVCKAPVSVQNTQQITSFSKKCTTKTKLKTTFYPWVKTAKTTLYDVYLRTNYC